MARVSFIRAYLRVLLLACGLAFAAASSSHAQAPPRGRTVVTGVDSAGVPFRELFAPGTLVGATAWDGGAPSIRAVDLNEEVTVLVELHAAPLAAAVEGAGKTGGLAAAEARVAAEHDRARAALRRVEAAGRAAVRAPLAPAGVEVIHTYRTAWNGFAVRTRRWVVDAVRALPEVERVYEDRRVAAVDDVSNAQIRADSVWTRLGATGTGRVIAILDTGVDYTHPALGSGMGPGRKVVGGYDFVNDDGDPRDDHGHGTHVAGIAAADAPGRRGVAPGAALLAVKVLDAEGNGYVSTVLAGIEYALDPDRNSGTDDAVDVLNLSLSGPGGPDDPLSRAVDDAVRTGVVVVVAAGNTAGYHTIGTPGAAAGALTVGAVDGLDRMAAFSSRGPTGRTFALKPDVVAPGVAVVSTVPGGYAFSDGTSMAAPHVAGAAALLKERHPAWTAEQVKAALMLYARDLGHDAWTQGSGRVDVFDAARATTLVVPASLSPGFVDVTADTWTWSETLRLTNADTTTQTFDLYTALLPPGTTVDVVPAGVTLGPGEAADVRFTLDVDNRLLPFSDAVPPAYEGRLYARSGRDTVAVPFAFVKTHRLALTIPEEPALVVIHDRSGGRWSHPMPGPFLETFLPAGSYDVLVTFAGADEEIAQVFVENVRVEGSREIAVGSDDARHAIRLSGLHPDGDSLRIGEVHTFCEHASGFSTLTTASFPARSHYTLHVSDVTPAYRCDVTSLAFPDLDRVSTYQDGPSGHFDGLGTSLAFEVEPSDFTPVDYTYAPDEGARELFTLDFVCRSNLCTSTYDPAPGAPNRLGAPFRRRTYHLPRPSAFSYKQEVYRTDGSDPDVEAGSNLLYDAGEMRLDADSLRFFRPLESLRPVLSLGRTGAQALRMGDYVPRWAGVLAVVNGEIRVRMPYGTGGAVDGYFLDPLGMRRTSPISFQYLQSDRVVTSGEIANDAQGAGSDRIGVWPGVPFEVELYYGGYTVAGRPGRARVRLENRSSGPLVDGEPPTLQAFALYDADGRLATELPRDGGGEIRLAVADDRGLESVRLAYRPTGEAAWTLLPLDRTGGRYRAAVPGLPAGGFFDLQVTAEDGTGNVLRYQVAPAFYVDGLPQPALLRPEDDAHEAPSRVAFEWDAVPEANGYHLQVAADSAFTRLVADDSTLAEPTLTAGPLAYATTHYWRVRARSAAGFGSWSPAFRFTVSTGTAAEPPDDTALPRSFGLHANYPNPFRDETTVPFDLPAATDVSLVVYDLLGREVARLIDETLPAGRYRHRWQPGPLPSGLYVYRLKAGDFVQARRFLLLK